MLKEVKHFNISFYKIEVLSFVLDCTDNNNICTSAKRSILRLKKKPLSNVVTYNNKINVKINDQISVCLCLIVTIPIFFMHHYLFEISQ